MPRRWWLLLFLALTPALRGQESPPAVSVASRVLHLPGTTTTVELPPRWELSTEVEGANLVMQGPAEHAMPIGEALAARPMIAITVNLLKPGDSAISLMQQAISQYHRLFSNFTLLSGNETSRTYSGRSWQYLHYTFELAQQSCNQELYISSTHDVVIYVVCSCAPSRAGAYQEVFSQVLSSMGGGTGTPLLGQPLAPAPTR